MASGKNFLLCVGLIIASLLSACSGSSSNAGNFVTSVSQDLTVDPSGRTTRVTFNAPPPAGTGPGNFQADGGQLALGILVSGNDVLVQWDDRVTPNHQVQVVSLGGVVTTPMAVVSTNPTTPTFTITGATQNPGLGGDVITVQFAGAPVVEAQAENPANWALDINGTQLDLTGSVLTLNTTTGVMTITLGVGANLHASFNLAATSLESVSDVALSTAPVAGVATGDSVAPNLVSVVQNLGQDALGFVVDFTFDEAVDPVFSAQIGNFDAGFPVLATSVSQPSGTLLRVSFSNPMIPGIDTVTLSGIVDAHGNPLAGAAGAQPIAVGTTVANGFQTNPVLDTVPNAGGDTLTVELVQAIDPDTAEDPTRWDVESPVGNTIPLGASTFSYDHPTATLTITLDQDLTTGDSFQVGPGATAPVDVDGEDFVSVFAGTVTGDVTAPSAVSALQERSIDPNGLTYDIVLSEDVDPVAAETPGNWTVTGGATVQTASLLAGEDRVRLTLDQVAVPGTDTFGVSNLVDLAGNTMGLAQTGVPLSSTDVIPPTASGAVAFAEEGADDDTVSLVFDDQMVASTVNDPLNWLVESPVGTALDSSLASVHYDPLTSVATLTFDGGDQVDLKRDDDFQVALQNMTDISGNVVTATPLSGDVDGETNFPSVETAWVETGDPSRLHVLFDEPMDHLDDLAGPSSYSVRDGGGLVIGSPASVVVDADRMGATLLLGFGVTAGVHTVDVSGVTDLAGNGLFPADLVPIVAEDGAEPALDPGLSLLTSVSGEDNDVITVVFDRPMSSWGIDEFGNFDVDDGGSSLDLSGASFSFDGDKILTIELDAPVADSLETGVAHTLTVDGLRSRQGVVMTGPSAEVVVAAGDATPAVQSALRTRIDTQFPLSSALIEFDEAIDIGQSDVLTNYLKGGLNPDIVSRLDYRTVRATWLGGIAVGEQIDVTMDDLAGNAGATNQLIQSAPTAGPVVTSVAGVITPGIGGDYVTITFNMPVDLFDAVNTSNYGVDQGGVPVNLNNVQILGDSATNTVELHLVDGVELDPTQFIHVTVDNVRNPDGIAISPPADLNGNVTGDATPPDFVSSFVNYRADAGGTVVDVLFTEDIHPLFGQVPANFTPSGGQTVLSTEFMAPDVLRLTLSAPLLGGDTIDTNMLEDTAGITSGAISTTPLQ